MGKWEVEWSYSARGSFVVEADSKDEAEEQAYTWGPDELSTDFRDFEAFAEEIK